MINFYWAGVGVGGVGKDGPFCDVCNLCIVLTF